MVRSIGRPMPRVDHGMFWKGLRSIQWTARKRATHSNYTSQDETNRRRRRRTENGASSVSCGFLLLSFTAYLNRRIGQVFLVFCLTVSKHATFRVASSFDFPKTDSPGWGIPYPLSARVPGKITNRTSLGLAAYQYTNQEAYANTIRVG